MTNARFAALADRHHNPAPARVENLLDPVAPAFIRLDPGLEEIVELVHAAELALTRPAREGAHAKRRFRFARAGVPLGMGSGARGTPPRTKAI